MSNIETTQIKLCGLNYSGKVRSLQIVRIDYKTCNSFCWKWHYSKITPPCKYYFGLVTPENAMIGVMSFGLPATPGVIQSYCQHVNDNVIELRRLCCVDDTPKNTESRFIGLCLRWLKKNSDFSLILSYADDTYGHEGVIYKASNFILQLGRTAPGYCVMYKDRRYHDRSLRHKRKNGTYTTKALTLRLALKYGKAYKLKSKGKNRYLYRLFTPKPRGVDL